MLSALFRRKVKSPLAFCPCLEPLEGRDVPASLGTALNYNGLIFGDLVVPTGADTEGRLAVGGSATFQDNYVVGAPPPFSSPQGARLPLDPTRDDFIVGRNILNDGGFAWVVNGNAVYGGTFTGLPLQHAAGSTRQQSPVLLSSNRGNAVTSGGQSFTQLRSELLGKSQFWGSLPARGVGTQFFGGGVLNLIGTDPTLNVFNVPAAQWSGTNLIRNIDAPAGSTVLINVIGPSVTINGGAMRLAGVTRENVLINFPQATAIASTDFDYEASVLAPLASAVFDGGILTGNGIFGGNVTQGGGFEFHNFTFLGDLPDFPPGVSPGPVAQPFSPQLGTPVGPVQFPAGETPIPEAPAVSKRMLLASSEVMEPAAPPPATGFPFTAVRLGPTRVAYGTGSGVAPTVLVVDTATGQEVFRIRPFPDSFTGGIAIAAGDVSGDGIADVVVGAGTGGGPNVKVFDGRTGAVIRSFFSYDSNFRGGVNVATGDVNGDGLSDVVTSPVSGGGPNVKVFDGATGGVLASFWAYASNVVGGVNVAAGDVDGDGRAEVVSAPAAGFAPHVRVWRIEEGVPTEVGSFYAFESAFTGGAFVSVGDLDGDGRAEILASPGVGGGPLVRAFSGTGSSLIDTMVFDAGSRTGVRTTVGDFNGDLTADLLIAPASGSRAVARFLPSADMNLAQDFDLEAAFPGVFVG
mgnify:FL=1